MKHFNEGKHSVIQIANITPAILRDRIVLSVSVHFILVRMKEQRGK
ncbi:MAG: hypothetical protein C5S41_02900 [Candidatus Methanomarinus sp.]|nr:MAG: hypothetical protein C5S41_02900 [ANME-2 cluster archaeon]